MPPPAARARSATMADTMLPAAPVTTTTESGPRASGRVGWLSRALLQADGEPDRAAPADLDDAGVAERLVDEGAGHVVRAGVGLDVERPSPMAAGRSRASALVKPLTAPAMALRAPASS